MTAHIGLVGCSAEGAALCYKTLCVEGAASLGGYDHPEVSIHTHSLGDYVRCLDADDWEGIGELMLSSANKLAAAGADILICPDNTIHRAMPHVMRHTPLPWLHIAEIVAKEAKRRQFKRVGLLGTSWLVSSTVYPEKLAECGIEFVRLENREQDEISKIIMDELVHGVIHDGQTACFQAAVGRMQATGCNAVVLGCTEIPLIMNDNNSALPTLDSTRLLARAALNYAIKA